MTVHAREPLPIPARLLAQLQAGRLEQTCGVCGRWEAAGFACSFCFTPTGPTCWYKNGLASERRSRMPKTAPANPAPEYLSWLHWPNAWGPFPRRLPQRHTPPTAEKRG